MNTHLQKEQKEDDFAELFQGEMNLVFDGADGKSEFFGDLAVTQGVVAAHTEDFLPFFRKAFDGKLEQKLHFFDIKRVEKIILKWQSFKAFQRNLGGDSHGTAFLADVVYCSITRHCIDVSPVRNLVIFPYIAFSPKPYKQLLGQVFRFSFRFQYGGNEGLHPGKIRDEQTFKFICQQSIVRHFHSRFGNFSSAI